MAPAQDIAPDVLATAHEIPDSFLGLVGNMDRRQLARAKQVDELVGVPAIRLDALPRAPRRQGRRDDSALDPTGGDLPLQVIPRDAGLVAGPDVSLARQPLEEAAD